MIKPHNKIIKYLMRKLGTEKQNSTAYTLLLLNSSNVNSMSSCNHKTLVIQDTVVSLIFLNSIYFLNFLFSSAPSSFTFSIFFSSFLFFYLLSIFFTFLISSLSRILDFPSLIPFYSYLLSHSTSLLYVNRISFHLQGFNVT